MAWIDLWAKYFCKYRNFWTKQTAGPIQVQFVMWSTLPMDVFEIDVLPILDIDGHMTNCTRRITYKKNRIEYDCMAYPNAVGHVINFAYSTLPNNHIGTAIYFAIFFG